MIKQPLMAVISLILLVVAIGFTIERGLFVYRANKTLGTVTKIYSENSRCGGGRRRSSYPCTKYSADFEFASTLGMTVRFNTSVGRCRGHDQPERCSGLQVGQIEPVIYDPGKPERAYHDRGINVWFVPIMLFVFQVITMVTSFSHGRRRRVIL